MQAAAIQRKRLGSYEAAPEYLKLGVFAQAIGR
jgi:hypothetical protein